MSTRFGDFVSKGAGWAYAWLPLALFIAVGLSGCSGEGSDGVVASDGDSETEANSDLCASVTCSAHASCEAATGSCLCVAGYVSLSGRCVVATEDGDADREEEASEGENTESESEQATDGDSTPADGDAIETNEEPDADSEDLESDESDNDSGLPSCPVPQAVTMPILHKGAQLVFSTSGLGDIETGTTTVPDASAPDHWEPQSTVSLSQIGKFKVFARLLSLDCAPELFRYVYDVRETYPPAAGQAGTTAVHKDDAAIVGWATAVESVSYGANVQDSWKTPDKALGKAVGDSYDIVCLGDGGQITLSFDPPIVDGPGYDFLIFENSFSDTFLELAYVEVSSDGINFLRFDSAYLGQTPVSSYGNLDTTLFDGLGGKYRQGYGNPFDLGALANRPEVRNGSLLLDAVKYVRIVDIIGDGNTKDCFGAVIYDPYPTSGSAGFDLDAVGVLNR